MKEHTPFVYYQLLYLHWQGEFEMFLDKSTCSLHQCGCSLLLSPTQSRPLYDGLGLLHNLVRYLTPLPQVFEQVPGSDQAAERPPLIPKQDHSKPRFKSPVVFSAMIHCGNFAYWLRICFIASFKCPIEMLVSSYSQLVSRFLLDDNEERIKIDWL